MNKNTRYLFLVNAGVFGGVPTMTAQEIQDFWRGEREAALEQANGTEAENNNQAGTSPVVRLRQVSQGLVPSNLWRRAVKAFGVAA